MSERITRRAFKNRIIIFLKSRVSSPKNRIWINELLDLSKSDPQEKISHDFSPILHSWTIEIVTELVSNNIICPRWAGLGNSISYEYFQLTEYGIDALNNDQALPYDPDGFLNTVLSSVELDAVTLRYLEESIGAYSRNLFLASAVMLGGASEHLILQLIERYASSTQDQSLQQALETDGIFRLFSKFETVLKQRKKENQALWYDFDKIQGLFTPIRLSEI